MMNRKRFVNPGILIWVLAIAFVGCKKDKGTAVFNPPTEDPYSCVWNGVYIEGDLAQKCCVNKQYDMSGAPLVCSTTSASTTASGTAASDGCPGGTPFESPITRTIDNFVQTASAGDAAIQSADALVGNTKAATNGAAASDAATAGTNGVDSSLLSSGNGGTSADSQADKKKLTPGRFVASSGNGGGAAGLNAGFGSGNGLGSVATAPAATGGTGFSGWAGDAASGKDGIYSGGGGGGAGGSNGSYGSGGYGSGFGGADSNKFDATVSDVGRDPASAASASSGPLGSTDPENYFSLLKPEDSIFKVVERRYVAKSRDWALSQASQVSGKMIKK